MQWTSVTGYLEELARETGGRIEGATLELTAAGWRRQVAVQAGKGSVTLTLRLWPLPPEPAAPGPSVAPLLLRPEVGLDRFGKRLRIARECQLGDAAFDARVYVDTEAADATVAEVLAAPAARRAVLESLDAGVSRVRLLGPRATVEATFTCTTQAIPDAMGVHALLGPLAALAAALPTVTELRRGPERGRRHRWVPLAAAILLPVLALTALLVHMIASQRWPLVDAAGLSALAWRWGLALWLPSALAVILIVRNRSNAMPAAVLALLSLPVTLICGIQGVTEVINGAHDRSPVQVREATVASRTTTSTKSGRSYHVRLAHRGPDGGDRPLFDVTISRRDFDRLPRGARYRLHLRRGALGWEHVIRHERVEAGK